MGLFFPEDKEVYTGLRKSGFPRYREVLNGSWKDFLKVGFITLIFHIPFTAGMVFAILSKSLVVAVISGVVGGAMIGPGYACMIDLIMRRLRDDKGDWLVSWKRAFRQNLRSSFLPGIVQYLFLAIIVFSGALMLWGAAPASAANLIFIVLSSMFLSMLMSVWWPQVVIFEQRTFIRLKNCVLFVLLNLWRMLGCALLQVIWWAAAFLLLPWSAFLVPFLGVWYILFLSIHLIYPKLDEAFKIEEQIAEKFPGRVDND